MSNVWHNHAKMGSGAEFDAIRDLLAVWGETAAGIGDDAALYTPPADKQLVLSVDACVEGVHFTSDWLTPEQVGARAAFAALSDLAAMGASADAILVAFTVPATWKDKLLEVAKGIGTAASHTSARIVGGNISKGKGDSFCITTTVVGSTAKPITRSGAKVGDAVIVTGELGGPATALASILKGESPSAWCMNRLTAPMPRILEGMWLAERGVTSMIDISDGILNDAEHIASASGVTVVLDRGRIPVGDGVAAELVLSSGEEYELLATVGSEIVPQITRDFMSQFGAPLTVIGHVSERIEGDVPRVMLAGVNGDAERGNNRVEIPRGHDHFSK